MDRKYDVITLGEILLRLSTPINGRLAQGDTFMKHLGGAELNIASEIGQLGLNTAIISKIPTNLLAAFIKNQLNASRVSENYLIEDHSDDSRIGIYYYEYGSYPRKPRVVYDRKHSSINNIEISDVPQTLFYNTRLFHTSGITLGLGGKAQDFAIHCIKEFKKQGTLISFDVNYRANLWTGAEARKCIEAILPYVDIFFCSEDTARLTFGKQVRSTRSRNLSVRNTRFPLSLPQSGLSSLRRSTILLPSSILQKMILITEKIHTIILTLWTVSEAAMPMYPVHYMVI